MRKLLILCAALSCFSLSASAQDFAAAPDALSPASDPAPPAAPASLIPADRDPWQVGVGFEYLHYNVLGLKFHDLGYQANVTRFLTNWFGIEGTAIAGFGSVENNSNINAKSMFLGGGAHVSVYNSNHLEPWVHVLVGWDRFRFTQNSGYGANGHAAFLAGGGLDYKIRAGRIYWRVQGDYIGTNVGPSLATNYSFGTGFVLNF
jgi:hypothetical protein